MSYYVLVFIAAMLPLVFIWGLVLLWFVRPLRARWVEPMFRAPVLCIESDDWGAGSLAQAALLDRIAAILLKVRDQLGRPAIMTLGVVQEVPDGPAIAARKPQRYVALSLADPRQKPILDAMQAGIRAGVFEPQMHGEAHYWPDTIMDVARRDREIRQWLLAPQPARTEALPDALQSRWIDAAVLPSRRLLPEPVRQSVLRESLLFKELFGRAAEVAVPNTFIWTGRVEAAWVEAGLKTVITPGRRMTRRDEEGRPTGEDCVGLTGSTSPQGMMWLVRDVFFEPARGHAPDTVAKMLAVRARMGRVCLVETHRSNFLDAPEASLAALEEALSRAVRQEPGLRFLAPGEIARAIRERDPVVLETRYWRRLRMWRWRLAEIPRFARAARLVGLGWLVRR